FFHGAAFVHRQIDNASGDLRADHDFIAVHKADQRNIISLWSREVIHHPANYKNHCNKHQEFTSSHRCLASARIRPCSRKSRSACFRSFNACGERTLRPDTLLITGAAAKKKTVMPNTVKTV